MLFAPLVVSRFFTVFVASLFFLSFWGLHMYYSKFRLYQWMYLFFNYFTQTLDNIIKFNFTDI